METRLAWDRFPQAEAILVFARALGTARTAETAAARRDVARLQQLEAAMTAASSGYWAGQTAFQIKAVEAWIALAEQRPEQALKLMEEAAKLEEASDKHPVTPGAIVPARELLGEMLLALDRPSEAVTQFERSLKRDPTRFRGIAGAAHAAAAAGDRHKAATYYAQLRALAADGDGERPELAEARAFVALGQ